MKQNIQKDIIFCPKKTTTNHEVLALTSFHKSLCKSFPAKTQICAVLQKNSKNDLMKLILGIANKDYSYVVESKSKNTASLFTDLLKKTKRFKATKPDLTNSSKGRPGTRENKEHNLSFLDSVTFTYCPRESRCTNLSACPLRLSRPKEIPSEDVY